MHVGPVPAHAIPHRDSDHRHFGLILNSREPARTLDHVVLTLAGARPGEVGCLRRVVAPAICDLGRPIANVRPSAATAPGGSGGTHPTRSPRPHFPPPRAQQSPHPQHVGSWTPSTDR